MLSRTLKPAFAIVMLSSMVLLCGTNTCKAAQHEVWLDSMETSKAYSEHYRTRSNRSASDNHLRIAGKQYEHGIGTHAPAQFCIDLDGKGMRFTAMVGIDDETNGQGSSAFKLIGDNRVLFSVLALFVPGIVLNRYYDTNWMWELRENQC